MTVPPLEAHLGYWLRFVSNQVSHAFGLKLADRGVTVAEWVVLRELHGAEALAPSALADRLELTRGAISKLAERLVAKALVARAAGEGDGRFQSLALTPAGRALVPELALLADRNDAEFFGHLSQGERAQVEAVMREILRRHGLKSIPMK
ncbi:MarR family transcriptional regulator [Roseococcus sp. SYP-B2431]|uniref:MarR family winged helix-turn-helix transcriptional regulator n=1 Tax=Roseococcus sp. SYP-B2431 TaxID=2496640 RepID=UPI0010390DCA|nr:MarR family transcriptional regulator [Roseococcus sp. SYP-B2431]TCH96684.1 MarR family transcriptional regulator [Roseococcus sp. SYP-B2431]